MNIEEIQTKIASRGYEPRTPYPEPLVRPAVLGKTANHLSSEEMKTLFEVKTKFDEDTFARAQAIKDRRREESTLQAELQHDLEKAYGVQDHPKADLVWQKAWEHGHSAGLSEVANYYIDFVELIL